MISKEEPLMPDIPDKNLFASLHAGQPPWDIGKPQKPFIDVAEKITGSILDAGCGTGENALYFASRGNKVTGIDYLEEPIKRAKAKAVERKPIRFETRPDFKDMIFSEGGPKAWFVVVRRA
jgi:SAM-dependent methyltransferase